MSDFNKITSTSELSSIGSEKLFTELTPEQAAAIEGGSFLLVDSIQAINADADTFDSDDTYITVNGQRLWGEVGMSTGQSATVNRGLGFDGFARIELFDADGGFNGSDDNMGGSTVAGPTNGLASARVSGSGSTYDVYYQVF